ncbi:unnamed protein product [Calypogeia fissa]
MSLSRWTTAALIPTGFQLHKSTIPERCPTAINTSFARRGPLFKFLGTSRKLLGSGVQIQCDSVPQCKAVAAAMKVFVVSDVHTDYETNMDWLRGLSSTLYKEDILICAGDVTDNLETFQTSMTLFKDKFKEVFFVPGNHDLWCRRKDDHVDDSLAKLKTLTDFCHSLGVQTAPANVNGVWIIPLLSWYHQSWDRERDLEGYHIPPVEKKGTDFTACKWPLPLDNLTDSIAQQLDELNVLNLQGIPNLQQTDCQVITFSHFLPRFELCPEKRMLLYPNLPKMVGSDWLESRIRSIHGQNGSPTACHIFGHTHLAWDTTLDGIRYIQAPLAYPKERERGQVGEAKNLPLCIYDSETGGLIGGPFKSKWSEYYRMNKRDPDNQQLAPWVEGHYQPVSDTPPELIQNSTRN